MLFLCALMVPGAKHPSKKYLGWQPANRQNIHLTWVNLIVDEHNQLIEAQHVVGRGRGAGGGEG